MEEHFYNAVPMFNILHIHIIHFTNNNNYRITVSQNSMGHTYYSAVQIWMK